MGKTLVEEKSIVVPGEKIAEGMDYLPSTGSFRDGEDIFANKLGILYLNKRVIKVVPISGRYMPEKRDTVIGLVTDVGYSGWQVDIGASVEAKLPVGKAVRERVDLLKTDLNRYYQIGDIIVSKVLSAIGNKISLTMYDRGLKKLKEGRIIKVTPTKVPRVIGKKGSMVSMLKEHTNCEITVGQNGYIWVNGPVEGQLLLEKAIQKIEENAHKSGLTDLIKEMLEKGVKNE